MRMILHTENLDVGYDGQAVIKGVDIQALKGQTICLIGPNGAGKSTILRTLTGMLAPVSGCVYVGEEDVRSMRPEDKARKMAVVLTERLNMGMTSAWQVVSMGRTPYTGFFGRLSRQDKEIVEDCMKTVGAYHLKDRDFSSLSDGEKQKVLIARALAQTPELIVLDEPTSHLDIRHKIEVVRILNRLALDSGLTVILALHDIDIAVKFCQIVLMVKEGRIVAHGRPEEIVKRDTVDKLYEIDGAFYDAILGSVEMCNDKRPDVYVAAGAGKGIPVYRMLSRMGRGVVTGVLAENDIDHTIADAMKLTVISGKSFEPIPAKKREEAKAWMKKCAFLIDAGFPVGQDNRDNLELLKQAAKDGRTVLCFREQKEAEMLYGDVPNVTVIHSARQLEEELQSGGKNGKNTEASGAVADRTV